MPGHHTFHRLTWLCSWVQLFTYTSSLRAAAAAMRVFKPFLFQRYLFTRWRSQAQATSDRRQQVSAHTRAASGFLFVSGDMRQVVKHQVHNFSMSCADRLCGIFFSSPIIPVVIYFIAAGTAPEMGLAPMEGCTGLDETTGTSGSRGSAASLLCYAASSTASLAKKIVHTQAALQMAAARLRDC